MIVDERLVTYINSLDTGNTEILDEIEREALETYVPIVRKEMQSFLKLILSIKRPARILEVGTAVVSSVVSSVVPVTVSVSSVELCSGFAAISTIISLAAMDVFNV